MKNENILEVSNLNVYYKDQERQFYNEKKKVEICRNISFQIKKGEVLGLVGESGSGKSTLAKSILGMVKDYSGEISHSSENPQMVFQDPYSSLNPVKKIGWILEEPLRLRGSFNKAGRKAKSEEMLARVGLDARFLDHFPRQLSGGQRQRVCIAAALMLEPQLLVADEPVSALDVTIQAQIIRLLLDLHRDMGLSILFISHDLRVVYQMSDRVMIMKSGEIIECGSVDAVYWQPKEQYTKMLLESAGIVRLS